MGGLCFIFGILVACGLVYAGFYRYAQDLLGIVQVRAALLALFLAFGSGFIGFLDDYIKVVKHRNLGLLAWQKLIMQFIVTGGFLVGLHMQGLLTTIIMLPFIGAVDLGWVYYPIAFFGIIFLVNAVNLTDGLDGLCSCVTFVSMLGYCWLPACSAFIMWPFWRRQRLLRQRASWCGTSTRPKCSWAIPAACSWAVW